MSGGLKGVNTGDNVKGFLEVHVRALKAVLESFCPFECLLGSYKSSPQCKTGQVNGSRRVISFRVEK